MELEDVNVYGKSYSYSPHIFPKNTGRVWWQLPF